MLQATTPRRSRPDPTSIRRRASRSTKLTEAALRAPRSATKRATTRSRSSRTMAARSMSTSTTTSTSSAPRPITKATTPRTGPTTTEADPTSGAREPPDHHGPLGRRPLYPDPPRPRLRRGGGSYRLRASRGRQGKPALTDPLALAGPEEPSQPPQGRGLHPRAVPHGLRQYFEPGGLRRGLREGVKVGCERIVLKGVDAKLTAQAAAALNEAFDTKLFAGGLLIGEATVNANIGDADKGENRDDD